MDIWDFQLSDADMKAIEQFDQKSSEIVDFHTACTAKWLNEWRIHEIDRNQNLLGLLSRLAKEKQATPAQISMAWMLCKKPYIVPIPGTRKAARLEENAGAADVKLTVWDVRELDDALDKMEMSEVFGGSKIIVK